MNNGNVIILKPKYSIVLNDNNIIEIIGGEKTYSVSDLDPSCLRKENKELRKQARRDQVAMAEALALLTLKKKPMPYGEWSRRIDTSFHQADDGGSCFRSAESRGSAASEL